MNFKILLIAISAVSITGCSTAYKSGQTPDDVYYSPARVIEEDDSREEERKEETVRNDSYEDREIRMATHDRRWRDYDDDYNCRYDPYRYGYTHGYYYNPYYNKYPVYLPGAVVTNPKNTVARMTNLKSYNNTVAVTSNGKTGTNTWISTQRPYNNSNNRREGFIRRVIEPVLSGSSNRSSSDNNSRTYTPSSSSSSSSGSSSGSKSTPVTRPGRGN